MAISPIPYVKAPQLCGSLFQPDGTTSDTSLVSGANTEFFVNHEEPLRALQWLQEEGKWPLGELPDGIGFLVVFEAPRRRLRSFFQHRAQTEGASV